MIILTGASGGIGKEIINHLCMLDDVIGFYNTTHPDNNESSKIIYEKVNIEDKLEVDCFVENWKSKLSNITLVHTGSASTLDPNFLASSFQLRFFAQTSTWQASFL